MAREKEGTVIECAITVAYYENPDDHTFTGFFKVVSRQPHVERVVPFKFDQWEYGKIQLQPHFRDREREYRSIAEGLVNLGRVVYEDATQAFVEMVADALINPEAGGGPQPAGTPDPNERGN